MRKLSLEYRISVLENILLEQRVTKLEKMLNEKVVGKMPKYFYHGTSAAAAEAILKNGLTPAASRKATTVHSLTKKNKVYLCINEEIAKNWASMVNRSDYVVLRIDSSYLNPDKLTGDYNALIDPFAYDDFDDEDDDSDNEYGVEPEVLDKYDNLRFDKEDELLADYEYEGSIPPEAIEVVYRTNASLMEEIQDALDNHDVKKCIVNWDKWKDADMGSRSFVHAFAHALSSFAGDPPNWENKKLQKILLSMPSNILNTEFKATYSNTTVLMRALNIYDGAHVQEILEAFADKKGISDTNIELLWKMYSKPWQTKNIEKITQLPDRFLQIGKPYISKKYYKQLGL